MQRVRLFTDEDVYGAIAQLLRAQGFDAISTPEAKRIGESDESQLAWASQENRVLFTFNVADFVRIHAQWLKNGRHHNGIVVFHQRPIGETIRRLSNFATSIEANEMIDRLEFLNNWPPQ